MFEDKKMYLVQKYLMGILCKNLLLQPISINIVLYLDILFDIEARDQKYSSAEMENDLVI